MKGVKILILASVVVTAALPSGSVRGQTTPTGPMALAAPPVFAVETTVLAKATLPRVPVGDFIYRVTEVFLDPNDPAKASVTHAHGAGMAYTEEGTHVMTAEGHSMVLDTGQADWVGGQITHTHATDGKALTRFLFFFPFYPAAQKGTPIPPALSNVTLKYESDVLTFADRGAKDVILSSSSYSAGQVGDTQTYAGPTLFNVQSGSFNVKVGNDLQVVQAGSYWTVQAGTPVQASGSPTEGGTMLALSIVPAGQPAIATSIPAPQPPVEPLGMPSTGSSLPPQVLVLVLLVAILNIGFGLGVRQMRSRHR